MSTQIPPDRDPEMTTTVTAESAIIPAGERGRRHRAPAGSPGTTGRLGARHPPDLPGRLEDLHRLV